MKMMRLARGGRAGRGVPEFELEAVGENVGAAVAGCAARAWSATEAKPQPADCNSCLRLVQGVARLASDMGEPLKVRNNHAASEFIVGAPPAAGVPYSDGSRVIAQANSECSVSHDNRVTCKIGEFPMVRSKNGEYVDDIEDGHY